MILVTGGTGFVGSRIVHALRAEERPVRCLVRSPERAGQLRAWGCELVQGDVTDPASLARAVEGCEAVVHLVAIIAGEPEEFERVMTRGTEDLVIAAARGGVRRFVLMSALGTSESSRELTPYFRSKWAMEQTVEASTLEHTIFRPSFVFGRDGGVLPTFMRLVRYAPVIPVIGPGTQRIQPIWIEDVAAYFAKSIDLTSAVGRTFEIGGPDVVTWDELYSRIAAVLGKRRAKVHLPFGLMRANAALLEALPGPTPLTRDQVTMLEAGDNVVSNDEAQAAFGLPLVPLDEQLRRAP
ncbi:MAG: complex I NDUFA9 subunit family protein [Actinobacteria bacterium]|nr:complex I NDUFA9 subunit family protein [Actinomycetota bacterium]